MMRRSCRSHAQHDEDEDDDERVVYYDLDADSHTRNLLLSPVAASAPRSAPQASADAQIFPRQQPPLFSLDDSGDEAEETEEQENPFATLIQQQQAAKPAQDEAAGDRGNSFLQVSATATSEDDAAGQSRGRVDISTNNSVGRPILKRRQEVKGFNARVTTKKKLGFESADSRPTRWSTQKPSAADTKNRRKSLGAIQKRRSQLEAASAKRRKSMSPSLSGPRTAQLTSNLDDSVDGSSAAPKRKSLSDVLQRATMLSQQQSTANDESLLSQTPATDPTDGDAILDTEHQMRTEPFAPQIFSPSKPVPAAGAISRKSKADGLISKVRGSIGDALRKAIRKSNRDLTLLRSRGQHLLPQQSNHSSSKGTVGAIESIQERGHIVVCLQRISVGTSQVAAYQCRVHEVAAKMEKDTAASLATNSVVLEALFQPQTAEYLKLSPGKLVKIYEPLHVVPEHMAAGSTTKPRWFLLSTQLAEVLDTGSGNPCSSEPH